MNIKLSALGLLFACLQVNAALVTVNITTPENEILPGTVVAFEPLQPGKTEARVMSGVMEQKDRHFAPHILAVQRGTKVTFPNLDDIKHHVYSFSDAKIFELQLYKGQQATPVEFDKYGIVELGCNVHDWMLGYIYVVDTPWFTQTTEQNNVTIELPDGDYRLKIWHSRFKERDAQKITMVRINGDTTLSFELSEALLPGITDLEDEIDEFSSYE